MAFLIDQPCVKAAFSFSGIIKPRQTHISAVCLNGSSSLWLSVKNEDTLSDAHLLILVADSNKDIHLNRKHWLLSCIELDLFSLSLPVTD